MTDTGFIGTVTGKIVRDQRTGAVVAQQVATATATATQQHQITPDTAASTPSPSARTTSNFAPPGPQVMKKLTVDGRRTRVTTATGNVGGGMGGAARNTTAARMTAQVF